MSSQSHPLRNSGIYRNLPNFDPKLQGLKAIICGATGISGFNTLRSLLDHPSRWSMVYALSRSPLSDEQMKLLSKEQADRVKHVSIDLSQNGEGIAKQLKEAGVEADYVFYYTYLQPKEDKDGNSLGPMDPRMADVLVDANVPPFRNFLEAISSAGIKPKRILLQTGGKNYGMHVGTGRTPLVESDPQPKHLTNNFYYHQERLLFEYCKNHPETSWNVIMPFGVIGAVPNASMNTFYTFGVYAAVQAAKGEPLVFGGEWKSWQFDACHSTARMTGYLSEWAVLEDHCANERFNAHDGSPLSWDRFFNELARWYGVSEVKPPSDNKDDYQVMEMAGGKDCPLGYGPPLTVARSYALSDWMTEENNKAVWKKLMESSGGKLTENPFESDAGGDIGMGDYAYLAFGTPSLNKVRRFGFNGFVDTLESIFEMYREMSLYGMLPPMKVDAARPMI